MASEATCSHAVLSAASRLLVYSSICCWSMGDMFLLEEVTVDGILEKNMMFVLLLLTMLWVLVYPLVPARRSALNFSLLM